MDLLRGCLLWLKYAPIAECAAQLFWAKLDAKKFLTTLMQNGFHGANKVIQFACKAGKLLRFHNQLFYCSSSFRPKNHYSVTIS